MDESLEDSLRDLADSNFRIEHIGNLRIGYKDDYTHIAPLHGFIGFKYNPKNDKGELKTISSNLPGTFIVMAGESQYVIHQTQRTFPAIKSERISVSDYNSMMPKR